MTNNKQKKPKESYPQRTIRLSQKTWNKLKAKRWKSRLSWEKFIDGLEYKDVDNSSQIKNKDI